MTHEEKLKNWREESTPDWIPSRIRLTENILIRAVDVPCGEYHAHCTLFGRVSIALPRFGMLPLKNSEFEVLEFRRNVKKQIAKQERDAWN